MTKEQAIRMAQASADRANSPMAVLNLNQFSPRYVVRDRPESFAGHKSFVCRVNPTKGPVPEYRALLDASDTRDI